MRDFSEYLSLPNKLEIEESNWLANPHLHIRQAKVVNDLIKEVNNADILEIGCATGNLIPLLNDVLYHGVEQNKQAIEIAKTKIPFEKRGLYFLHNADIRDFKFSTRHWGIVCCFAFLKHFGLHEWQTIFEKCALLGEYFIFDMQIADETKDDGIEFHHVWKSIDGLNKSIYDAGLTLIKTIDGDPVAPIFVCKRKHFTEVSITKHGYEIG